MSKVIAWWSGGITSAVACALALKKHPDAELVYIWIKEQHEDTYRFMADCAEWYGKGIHIVRSEKYGASAVQCITDRRWVNGPGGASCSKFLKKDVRADLQDAEHFDVHVMGYEFDVTEIARAVKFKKDFSDLNPSFPLIDASMNKNQCAGILMNAGIELPTMYRLGYHNNNCVGCVKGGAGYWNKIKKDFPEVFAKMMIAEELVGHSCINGTFLKDLMPDQGRHDPPIAPECGPFCGEEEDGLFEAKARSIFAGQMTMALA